MDFGVSPLWTCACKHAISILPYPDFPGFTYQQIMAEQKSYFILLGFHENWALSFHNEEGTHILMFWWAQVRSPLITLTGCESTILIFKIKMKSQIFHFLYCKTKEMTPGWRICHVKKDVNNCVPLCLSTVPQLGSEQGYHLKPGYWCSCKHTDQLRDWSVSGIQT